MIPIAYCNHCYICIIFTVIILFRYFITGIGSSFYYSFGIPYIDDNVSKQSSPLVLRYHLELYQHHLDFQTSTIYIMSRLIHFPTKTINNRDHDDTCDHNRDDNQLRARRPNPWTKLRISSWLGHTSYLCLPWPSKVTITIIYVLAVQARVQRLS